MDHHDRARLIQHKQQATLHEAAYLVTTSLGGTWDDAVSLLTEWVQAGRLPADVAPDIDPWSGKVTAPIDPSRTTVAVAGVKALLETLTKPESGTNPSERKPRWQKWRLTPEVRVWQAVALSLNIEPGEIQEDTISGGRYPYDEGDDFNDRLDVIDANISNEEYFPTLKTVSMNGPHLYKVRLSEFARFATEVAQWDVPGELRALADSAPPAMGGVSAQDVADTVETGNNRKRSFSLEDGDSPVIDCEEFITKLVSAKFLDVPELAAEENDAIRMGKAEELRQSVEDAVRADILEPRGRDMFPFRDGLPRREQFEPFSNLYFERESFVSFARKAWMLSPKATIQETFIDAIPLARAAVALAVIEVGEDNDDGIIGASERKWQTVLDHLLKQGKLPLFARQHDGEMARFEPTTELQGAWIAKDELRRLFSNPPREAIEEFERKTRKDAGEAAREEAARRADGRYTLREAAKEIARNGRGDWLDMANRLKDDCASDKLKFFKPGSTLSCKLSSKPPLMHPYYLEIYWCDLNAWIEKNEPYITFRFPAPATATERNSAASMSPEAQSGPPAKVTEGAPPSKSTANILHSIKDRRRGIDDRIDEAITKTGSYRTATVLVALRDVALNEIAPFTGHIEGDALCYTNDKNKSAKLTRDALDSILRRRWKASGNVGKRC